MLHQKFIRFAFFLLALFSTVYCSTRKRNEENAKKGELLFNSTGCPKCHSISGENMYGPPLNGIFGEEVEIIRGGTKETIVRDRDYIIRSITQPEAEKLIDFKDKIMPPVNLRRVEIKQITDYLLYINSASRND